MAEGTSNRPILWDESNIPTPEDKAFKGFINYSKSSTFLPKPEQCHHWENATNPKNHSSFGDKGTTATVGAYGNIVQFDTFIGRGHSGMFTTDHACISEPYVVGFRTHELHELSAAEVEEPSERYGLRITGLTFADQPRQTWVDYRWPRYEFADRSLKEGERPRKTNTVQWMVHNNVVIQHCTITNFGDSKLPLSFEFLGDKGDEMRIRDLDHVDPRYKFNELYKNYTNSNGLHGYSWTLAHKLEPSVMDSLAVPHDGTHKNDTGIYEPTSTEESVVVVVSVFLNGQAMQWGRPEQWKTEIGCSKDNEGSSTTPTNVAELVIAYKMILAPASKAHWRDLLIPASYTDIDKLMSMEPSSTLSLSALRFETDTVEQLDSSNDDRRHDTTTGTSCDDKLGSGKDNDPISGDPSGIPAGGGSPLTHIEYVVRRNLEHILSVCAVPLEAPRLESDGKSQELIPVALTCGPMSFHRITASSSYFAFQFLLETAQRLKRFADEEDSYGQWLIKRIATVCKGHLSWISESSKQKEDGSFVANYWVTGKILKQGSESWQPDNSMTDNPFQIIKAGNHAEVFSEDKSRATAMIRDMYLPWLCNLEKQDRCNSFVWPHAKESNINVYRLDDHVWLWKALKIIDNFGLLMNLNQGQSPSNEASERSGHRRDDLRRWARNYGYQNVQREILRRFTMESDVPRKRMLAVTRSLRETRFLFHARDTVLFYEFGSPLLPETSFRQALENSVKAQKHHDENKETRWDKALRYALSIVMGTDDYGINKDKSPARLVETSLYTLLRSSSQNGLFAGQLDETTKEPLLFYKEDDRDFYFHASFEIPYIILNRAAKIVEAYDKNQYSRNIQSHQGEDTHDGMREFSARLTVQQGHQSMEGDIIPSSENTPNTRNKELADIIEGIQQRNYMMKSMPPDAFIDSSENLEISEEWLYNYPSFLSDRKGLAPSEIREQLARFVIESRDIHEITELIVEDAQLAVSIVQIDKDLRNRLCYDLVHHKTDFCFDMLEDSANTDLRQNLTTSLDIKVDETVRDFLSAGVLHQKLSDHRVSHTSSTDSTSLRNRAARQVVLGFLEETETAFKLERIFHERAAILDRIVHEYKEARRAIFDLLLQDTEILVRILLRHELPYNKVKNLPEQHDRRVGSVTLNAAWEQLERAYSLTYDATIRFNPSYSPYVFDDSRYTAAVVNRNKKRTQDVRKRIEATSIPRLMTNLTLWTEYINVPRTAESGKKRFIFLPQVDMETALICFLGSPDILRPSISLFFNRHKEYDLYFFNQTTVFLNTWETELQLSFYQPISINQEVTHIGIPTLRRHILPGRKGTEIIKTSMGFHFLGDFFDHYWTCHFIESIQKEPGTQTCDLIDEFSTNSAIKRGWKQRKILELLLFGRILDTLVKGTRAILEKIKQENGVLLGAFSSFHLKSNDYFSLSEHWQDSQQLLRGMEDHMKQVIAIVDSWESREEVRGIKKPRWTRKQEGRYRGDLKELLISNNRKTRDVRSLHVEIRTLKDFFKTSQDQIQNDLSLHEAKNVRFFTYVTVVFLPLSFAASIFSMSGVPESSLIGQMALIAAVAFVLTIFALVNVETLGVIASTISHTILLHSEERMKQSYFAKLRQQDRKCDQDLTDGHERLASDLTRRTNPSLISDKEKITSARPGDKDDWHIWFWVLYVFVEVPARRAAIAYNALITLEPTPAALFSVFVGILALPWCILVWLIQVAVFNIKDLITLMCHTAINASSNSSSESNLFFGNKKLLLRPGRNMRPFLKVDSSWQKKRAENELQRKKKENDLKMEEKEKEFQQKQARLSKPRRKPTSVEV